MKLMTNEEKIRHYLKDPYLNPPSDIDYYLNGNCDIFAVALSLIYPLDVYAIYQPIRITGKGNCQQIGLVHAYCYNERTGIYVDARGITNYERIKSAYGITYSSDITLNKIKDVHAFLNYINPDYKVDEIRKAVIFIEKYYSEILNKKFKNYSGVKFG